MAYDEGLAHRIRELFDGRDGLVEKKMFGGTAFMVQGNLCCGVTKDDLIVRVGPAGHAAALEQPHARVFVMTGRPMQGWVWSRRRGSSRTATWRVGCSRG